MSGDTSDENEFFEPDFDLAAFRLAGARYVKLLIRARWKAEGGFLSSAELRRWKLENISQDELTSEQLLRQAANQLARLNRDYLPGRDSGGVAITRDDPVGRLIVDLAFLVRPEGGGDWNCVLNNAADCSRAGNGIDWPRLAEWEHLPQIRDDLDQLPDGKDEEAEERDRGDAPQSSSSWHSVARPSRHPCRFHLEGTHTLKALCNAIQTSRNTLRAWNANGHVWVQRCGGQRFEIWFASEALRDKARKHLLRESG